MADKIIITPIKDDGSLGEPFETIGAITQESLSFPQPAWLSLDETYIFSNDLRKTFEGTVENVNWRHVKRYILGIDPWYVRLGHFLMKIFWRL